MRSVLSDTVGVSRAADDEQQEPMKLDVCSCSSLEARCDASAAVARCQRSPAGASDQWCAYQNLLGGAGDDWAKT